MFVEENTFENVIKYRPFYLSLSALLTFFFFFFFGGGGFNLSRKAHSLPSHTHSLTLDFISDKHLIQT